MDETTRSTINRITVSYEKPTILPSGHTSTKYFDTTQLTGSELARLAAAATGALTYDTFDVALGMAYTGVFFSVAVAGGRQMAVVKEEGGIYGARVEGQRVLIVDDVTVTGNRLSCAAKLVEELGGEVVGFVVIVDRLEQPGRLLGKPVWSAYQLQLSS